MSAIPMILLSAAVTATAVGGAALYTARGLHRKMDGLRAELDAQRIAAAAGLPAARSAASTDEVRVAVAEALAEERERELAEARAFWAAQEAREGDDGALLAGHGTEYEIAPEADAVDDALLDALLEGRVDDDAFEDLRGPATPPHGVFIPRQNEREIEPALDDHRPAEIEAEAGAAGTGPGSDAGADAPGADAGADREPPELTAARRRHPSQPDYTLSGEPVVPAQAPSTAPAVADQERTVERLEGLALARTPLADVRQGPLGTLDVYLFEDGTTLCLSPGHRETSERLCEALDGGDTPYLMGGSTVSGAYALTFTYGEGRTAYLLADRVIASL